MVIEDVTSKVLEYLKKQRQTNTFRLATELGIDRHRILDIIKKLEEKGAVEVQSGVVRFLKFPREEKGAVKTIPKPKTKIKHKAKNPAQKKVLENVTAENKRLKEKISELQKLPPKIIRQTKVKKIPFKVKEYITKIKKVPVKSKKLKEQAEHIKELEEKVRELEKKASKPKIIRKTIVKRVPKIIRKIIIKKAPIRAKKKKTKKVNLKKFKLPKIDFPGLYKNIKKIRVPEMLKK